MLKSRCHPQAQQREGKKGQLSLGVAVGVECNGTSAHRSRAFTLIELLVVVAIIAILAAILVPVVNSSLESTRETKGLSNIKAVGTALLAFTADNNGLLPPHQVSAEPATRYRQWPWKLIQGGYIEQAPPDGGGTPPLSSPVWYSPASRVPSVQEAESYTEIYGLRQWRRPGASSTDLQRYKPLASIARPAKFPLIFDSERPETGRPWYSIATGSGGNSSSIALRYGTANPHAHAFFADGHVAGVTAEDLERIADEQKEYGYSPVFRWFVPEK